MACKIHNHLFLFSLIFIFSISSFTIHANLNLHPSDLNSLNTLLNGLKVNGQLQTTTTTTTTTTHPCNKEGVFCEKRISNNENYVLRITRLVFESKKLNGFLSSSIGNLTELKELSLSNNQIVDFIPPQIVHCTKLEILDLKNNHFSGEVPSELSYLVRLRVLDFSSNFLSGNLNFLTYFPNLETLNLADNLFIGRVPPSIHSFRNLRHFNFSGNGFLEGYVPTDSVPKRYKFIESSSGRSYSSAPAPKFSMSDLNTPPSPAPSGPKKHHHESTKRKVTGWVVGLVVGSFAGTIAGLIFSLMFKLALAWFKRGAKISDGPAIYSPLIIKKKEDLAFLEKEDGLASFELIGRGGCGEVYKAELPGSDGKIIAIKMIVQPSKETAEFSEEDSKIMHTKMRQIRSEINTVGQIRHRNLLPLLAHLSRPDCHYLVYEYMKNGSLQDVLNKVESGESELDWLTRHKIAVGIAAGLEYLHMNHSPRIIHRDLKPANVLLDDDMEARIADFGLAKVMPDAQTHITTSNVAGTVGYIAPEYHQILKFTAKCDIYSFGVILGVLVIGKLPSDDFFQHTDEMSLVKWMRNVMTSENPKRAIDTKLIGNGYEEQMLLVLKISCFCTLDDPKERPNSKDVRCMLSQIKH